MAFWAEALTYSHLLWGEDDVAAARRALSRLGSTRDARLAKAGTPRERAYGAAVEALYAESDLAGPRAWLCRCDASGRGACTPDDLDAAAFTSLALMFAEYLSANCHPTSGLPPELMPSRLRSASFRTDPRHPGGTHYLIHATDDPALAARGLDAARLYARIAPDAEHALHMPSHIFVQLGLWDDAVASNERAWAASKAEVRCKKTLECRPQLPCAAMAPIRLPATGSLPRGARSDRHRAAVLAGVDLNAALHVDARYTVGWLEFVHAANTGEWSGDVCRQSEPADAQVTSSDRERSFHALAAYRGAVAPVMCGLGDGAVAAIRARVDALPATDSSERTLRTALLHARLALYASTGSAE